MPCGLLADPRDHDVVVALVDEALAGARVRRELRWRDPRGCERVASVITAPVVGADGAVQGGLAVARDVTEERRLATRLVERERLAAMGQLVGGIAHELNNPLAGVLAVSELLLGEPALAAEGGPLGSEGAALRALVVRMERDGHRAAATVRRLVDFARQQRADRAFVDVNRVLLDALDQRRTALRAAGVDLVLALDYEAPAVWADAHQLQQVLLALVTNAEQALAEHPGPRRLQLSTAVVAERVRLTVEDSGPGLAPGVAERAMEPFYTTRAAGEGHGLGLAVALGIVREHGGQLTLAPTAGGGATFVVELPPADLLVEGD
jgi:signal transduction histidine kinase